MNYKYQVEVLELKEVHEIPDAWNEEKLLGLLNHIEYEDVNSIAVEELKEMTPMALSDDDPEEAAVKTLEFRIGDELSKGQRRNLAEELRSERLWEEYADIRFHEELFNVACMLYWAFPKLFPEPDIVRIKLKITSLNKESAINLQAPNASFLARLLNDGMDEHNAIFRLFNEDISANLFKEAEHVLWKIDETGFSNEDHSNTFTIYTSWNWVDELKGVRSFQSTAFADGQYI